MNDCISPTFLYRLLLGYSASVVIAGEFQMSVSEMLLHLTVFKSPTKKPTAIGLWANQLLGNSYFIPASNLVSLTVDIFYV